MGRASGLGWIEGCITIHSTGRMDQLRNMCILSLMWASTNCDGLPTMLSTVDIQQSIPPEASLRKCDCECIRLTYRLVKVSEV